MFLSLGTAFGAGVLASLSPCVYPLIPLTLGYLGQLSKNKASLGISLFSFIAGHTAVLIILGLLAARLGESFGFASQDPMVRIGIGVFLIVVGIFSLSSRLPAFFDKLNMKTQNVDFKKFNSFVGPFLLGASTALMASPCSTPILATTLTLLASKSGAFQGVVLMSVYSVGFLFIFALLGFGVVKASKLPRSGAWMKYVHTLGSLAIIAAGLYYGITGWQELS